MISWIQRTFQQHFKWLFLALLVVVIISFVFITNASSGLGRAGHAKLPDRPFFDLNLAKQDDVKVLIEDAQLSLYLRRPPYREQFSEAELQEYALQRYAALHLANELRIPTPSPNAPEVANYIQTLGRFIGANGQFDPKAYASFIDSLKTNPRLSEADVARVLIDDVRADVVERLLAGPGYVLPGDIAEQLARRDTRWTLAIAKIDGSAFAPRIDTSDTALSAWYETNSGRYEIGARVAVAAIKIPAARFADSVKLTDAEIRAAYDANPARYPAPAEIKIDADGDAAFARVRSLVETDLRKQRAEKAALSAADDLAVKLLEHRVSLEGLPAFLASQNVEIEEVGPVGLDSVPAALGGQAAANQISTEALRLTAERPYSNPLTIPGGATILVWRESIAPRVPALDEVREKALADYQAAEKRRLFNEAGRALRETTASALASGKAFAETVNAAAAQAGLKVEIKTPETFALTNPPQDLDYMAYQALTSLNEGAVSEFIPAGETRAVLVHAIKKEVPAFDPNSPAAAEMKTQIAPIVAERNAQSILAAIVEAELAKSGPAIQ